jgi:SAM-dependent methyltransferase
MSTDIQLETVNCDLCGSDKSRTIYNLRDTLYQVPGEFTFHLCLDCGLIYLNPRPSHKSIEALYPHVYHSFRSPIDQEGLPIVRWMRQRKISKRRHLIEHYSGFQEGALLDVGCSTGLFLNEMSRAGWKVWGVEPVTVAANFAKQYFDLNVFNGLLEESPFTPGSFDVITFWDVLEHTFSPKSTLTRASVLLRGNGLLAISIPNWDSLERRLFGPYWQGLDPPRHFFVFTRKTLSDLLDQTGFQIVDWRCEVSGYFSLALSLERMMASKNRYFALVLRKMANVPGMRLPFEPMFMLLNWLKKGSTIFVFARKTRS